MSKIDEYKTLIDNEIKIVSEKQDLNPLGKAMQYSLEAGGKRIRPILCFLAAELVSDLDKDKNLQELVTSFALAIEMMHTYSLVQDDLPALDNDDLRRGKATNHVIYGEAGAILASDGLFAEAMSLINGAILANDEMEWRERGLRASAKVLEAIGSKGMLWGQWLDLACEGKIEPKLMPSKDLLLEIHRHKTGDLIQTCLEVGVVLAGASEDQVQNAGEIGRNIGLCFQITDDILDETGTTEELGKTAGKDLVEGKLTYPSLFGLEKSRELAKEARDRAKSTLEVFGERGQELSLLIDQILTRTN